MKKLLIKKTLLKKLIPFVATASLLFAGLAYASILGGWQGGTGIGSVSSSSNGYYLQVSSTTPFLTYTLSPVSSQWTTTSTSIYYNLGNVGIGTTAPTSTLQINGSLGVINASGTQVFSIPSSTQTNLFEVDTPIGIPALIISSTTIQNYEGVANNRKTIVANYQILNTDNILSVYTGTSSITLTLPNNSQDGQIFTISDDSGNASLYPIYIQSSSTIDGTSTIGIYNNYGSLTFIFRTSFMNGLSVVPSSWEIR